MHSHTWHQGKLKEGQNKEIAVFKYRQHSRCFSFHAATALSYIKSNIKLQTAELRRRMKVSTETKRERREKTSSGSVLSPGWKMCWSMRHSLAPEYTEYVLGNITGRWLTLLRWQNSKIVPSAVHNMILHWKQTCKSSQSVVSCFCLMCLSL